MPLAAFKAGAVGLPRNLPARGQRGERPGTAPRPARPAREGKRALPYARGRDKKALEGGVRPAVLAGTERHGERERQFHFPGRRGGVFQAQLVEKRPILGRKRRVQGDVHAVQGAFVARAAGVEAGAALQKSRLPTARRTGGETDVAAGVEQVAKAAVGQDALAGVEGAAAGGQKRRRPRAKEQVRVHEAVFRASQAGDAILGMARVVGRKRLAPPEQLHAGGGLFLQQQREGARLGDVFKAVRDGVVRQRVGQRRQRHALMMRHVAFDQFRAFAGARAGVVGGFIKAVFPRPARLAHGQHVVRYLAGQTDSASSEA